jgi:hypothetical protein
MLLILGLFIVPIISGMIGCMLDVYLNIKMPQIYWIIGFMSGVISRLLVCI